MIVWIDAQISPHLAAWFQKQFDIECYSVELLGLDEVSDSKIFAMARDADVVVMTKDDDFLELQSRHGVPPQLIWIRCGNTSNSVLKNILVETFPRARRELEIGAAVVEIGSAR